MIDIILISFIIAFLRGGRSIKVPDLKNVYLLVISLITQLASIIWVGIGNFLISLSYIFILLFFYSNRTYEEIRIFMIGWFLNAVVILANMGKMPVDLEKASMINDTFSSEIVNGINYKHIPLTEDTLLPFLGDIIYMPYIVPKIISIGDVFVMIGAFLLIQRLMEKPISLIQLREGKRHAANK